MTKEEEISKAIKIYNERIELEKNKFAERIIEIFNEESKLQK